MKRFKNKTNFIVLIFASCVLLFTVAIFSGIIGMIMIPDNTVSENKDNKIVNQDLGNILSGTVELTIPKDAISLLGDNFDYSLTEEQKEKGFIGVKKNEDGSATYTIKKKDYKVFLSEYKKTAMQGIDELTKDGNLPSVKSITYNDDLSKITIIAERESFENGFDSMVVMSCGLASSMYQMFDLNSNGKCTVEVKDSTTGEVFQTAKYPDDLNNN